MKYAAKVYTDDIFLGVVSGNSLSSIKRAATRKCNRYFRMFDTFVLYRASGKEVADIKFMRVNRKCPNNTIQRGEWR